MNKTKLISLFMLFCMVTVATQAQNKKGNDNVSYDEATARSINPVAMAHTTPIVADLSVTSQRIAHSETFENALTQEDIDNPSYSAEINYLKDYTLTRAAELNNADIILVPIYNVKTSDDMKTITVKVTGYPATYTNFRKATNADLELIRSSYNTSEATPKPSVTKTTIIKPIEQ